jgi:hypothetical protein
LILVVVLPVRVILILLGVVCLGILLPDALLFSLVVGFIPLV